MKKILNIGIVGLGSLGRALISFYEERNDYKGQRFKIYIQDRNKGNFKEIGIMDILNICFPNSPTFIQDVLSYIKEHQPSLCIIHSNVVPGTTEKIEKYLVPLRTEIVFSPIMGPRSELLKSLKIFRKIFGYNSIQAARLAEIHFQELGVLTQSLRSTNDVEACILLIEAGLILNQTWAQEKSRIARKLKISEGVAKEILNVWNEGFHEFGMFSYFQPLFKPEVLSDLELKPINLLSKRVNQSLLKIILKSNRLRKEEEHIKRISFVRIKLRFLRILHYFKKGWNAISKNKSK